MRTNRRAASMYARLAGQKTTRVKRVVRVWQASRPNTVPTGVGSPTRIRSRDSKDEHERCVTYMSVALPMVKGQLEEEAPHPNPLPASGARENRATPGDRLRRLPGFPSECGAN